MPVKIKLQQAALTPATAAGRNLGPRDVIKTVELRRDSEAFPLADTWNILMLKTNRS
jgi:hypothetical protein